MLKYTKIIALIVAILFIVIIAAGRNIDFSLSTSANKTAAQTLAVKKFTVKNNTNKPAITKQAHSAIDGTASADPVKREQQTSANEKNSSKVNKNQHKPLSITLSKSVLSRLKTIYLEDSEEYNKYYEEYRLLVNDPLFKLVETARESNWKDIVSRVMNGEIDPNAEVGLKLKEFNARLGDIQKKMQQKHLSEEQRLRAELVKQGRMALVERLPQTQLTSLFTQLLRSANAGTDDIEAFIQSGAKINSEQLISIILSPKGEEAVKLDRIKLLVEYGVEVYGDITGNKMTSFEASMIRGNFAIADYLVSMGVSPIFTNAANTAVLSPAHISDYTLNYLEKFGLKPDLPWLEFKRKYKYLSDSIERSYH